MNAQPADQPLSALTVADLQILIRETVVEVLQEIMGEPDAGSALHPKTEARAPESIEYVRTEGTLTTIKEAGTLLEQAAEDVQMNEMSKDTILQLTALIEPEGDGYVATCPEVDVVSQGQTVEEARQNLLEADLCCAVPS